MASFHLGRLTAILIGALALPAFATTPCPSHVDAYTPPGTGQVWSTVSDGSLLIVNRGADGFQVFDATQSPLGAPLATVTDPITTVEGVKGMALRGNLLFTANNIVRIYDLSNPASPTLINAISGWGGGYDGAYDVAAQGNLLAIAHATGLRIYHVGNPTAPQFRGSLSANASWAGNVTFHNGLLYWTWHADTTQFSGEFVIVDVSNPSAPIRLGSLTSTHLAGAPQFKGDVALAGNFRGVRAIDISDPTNPTQLSFVAGAGAFLSSDIAIDGDYLYQADIVAGIRLWDITNPALPVAIDSYSDFSSISLTIDGDLLYASSTTNGLQVLSLADSDGDGSMDACDLCAGPDDADCNLNGIIDGCETVQWIAMSREKNSFGTAVERLTFQEVPPVVEDVELTIETGRSLDDTSRYLEVYIEDEFLGQFFVNPNASCAETKTATVSVDAAIWNLARENNSRNVTIEFRFMGVFIGDCIAGFVRAEVLLPIDADVDGDGIPNECDVEDCDQDGIPDALQWDEDGDGVIDTCDVCPGFDDNTDSDGDGTADGCDLCEGVDDRIDCNGDGVPDGCQLEGDYDNSLIMNPGCESDGWQGSSIVAPAASTDITLSIRSSQISLNFDDPNEWLELRANGVTVGRFFERAQTCDGTDTLIVSAADWNTARALDAGVIELRLVRNNASCNRPISCSGGGFQVTFFDIQYSFDADLNNNGWLDECTPDCNPDGPDTDGDGVPDNCDRCPNTIPGHNQVDGYGCPIHTPALDGDNDGDVDADDLADLASITGPETSVGSNQPLDTDADQDLDMLDVADVLTASRGRDVSADPIALGATLPIYRLIRESRTWTDAQHYCEAIYGTHLAAVDKTSAIPQQAQIDMMKALAAEDPNADTWIGLYFDLAFAGDPNGLPGCNCQLSWAWTNGQYLDPVEHGGDGVTSWHNGQTPTVSDVATGQNSYFVALWTTADYNWRHSQNNSNGDVRNFIAQLPPSTVPALPATTTQTVTVTLDSASNGQIVAPGDTVNWTISFNTSTGDNAGLALLVTDLVQDENNPALFDIPKADAVPTAMGAFAAPAGINNPAENGADSGYLGVQRGAPGALNLAQIGGAQNNLGEPLSGGVVGQNVTVEQGVGQSGTQVLATGSFTAPSALGSYTFALDNTAANVIDTLNAAPLASEVIAANVDLSGATLTFDVRILGCPGDIARDGVVDLSDFAGFLAAFGSFDGDANYNAAADLDSDLDVDLSDLAGFLALFGLNCG